MKENWLPRALLVLFVAAVPVAVRLMASVSDAACAVDGMVRDLEGK